MTKDKERFFHKRTVLFSFLLLLFGCAYSGTLTQRVENYAVLYGSQQWQKDTGWEVNRLEETGVPLWDGPAGLPRQKIDHVAIGATVQFLEKSEKSLRVVHPLTHQVGWIDLIYVETTFIKSLEAPSSIPSPAKTVTSQQNFNVSADMGGNQAFLPSAGILLPESLAAANRQMRIVAVPQPENTGPKQREMTVLPVSR